MLKSDLLRCIKKISDLLAKMVTCSKKFCLSSMIIGHYYYSSFSFECCVVFEAFHEECDVTQFNQHNLNSSFSIELLIN